jgi:hypothetical protein
VCVCVCVCVRVRARACVCARVYKYCIYMMFKVRVNGATTSAWF